MPPPSSPNSPPTSPDTPSVEANWASTLPPSRAIHPPRTLPGNPSRPPGQCRATGNSHVLHGPNPNLRDGRQAFAHVHHETGSTFPTSAQTFPPARNGRRSPALIGSAASTRPLASPGSSDTQNRKGVRIRCVRPPVNQPVDLAYQATNGSFAPTVHLKQAPPMDSCPPPGWQES